MIDQSNTELVTPLRRDSGDGEENPFSFAFALDTVGCYVAFVQKVLLFNLSVLIISLLSVQFIYCFH